MWLQFNHGAEIAVPTRLQSAWRNVIPNCCSSVEDFVRKTGELSGLATFHRTWVEIFPSTMSCRVTMR